MLFKLLGLKRRCQKAVYPLPTKKSSTKAKAPTYSMKKYDGNVSLFNVKIWDCYDIDIKYLGGECYADDSIVLKVKSTHKTMGESQVGVFAAKLHRY